MTTKLNIADSASARRRAVNRESGELLLHSIGEVIRKRREELGLSQGDVADKLGLKSDFIGLCEKDRRWIWVMPMIPPASSSRPINIRAVTGSSPHAGERVCRLLFGPAFLVWLKITLPSAASLLAASPSRLAS